MIGSNVFEMCESQFVLDEYQFLVDNCLLRIFPFEIISQTQFTRQIPKICVALLIGFLKFYKFL